jgi:hypothetical protein
MEPVNRLCNNYSRSLDRAGIAFLLLSVLDDALEMSRAKRVRLCRRVHKVRHLLRHGCSPKGSEQNKYL